MEPTDEMKMIGQEGTNCCDNWKTHCEEASYIWNSLEKTFNISNFLMRCFVELFGKVSYWRYSRIRWLKNNNKTKHGIFSPNTFGWVRCYRLLSIWLWTNHFILFIYFFVLMLYLDWNPRAAVGGEKWSKAEKEGEQCKVMYFQAGHCSMEGHSQLLISRGISWEAV